MSVTHADFTIERRYPYSPAQTFSAFAEPELRRGWFANPGGWDESRWGRTGKLLDRLERFLAGEPVR
jgi:uncharacterized protein YndB with AHSA1/START domain